VGRVAVPAWWGFAGCGGSELPCAQGGVVVEGLFGVVDSAVAIAAEQDQVVDVGGAFGRRVPWGEVMDLAAVGVGVTEHAALVSNGESDLLGSGGGANVAALRQDFTIASERAATCWASTAASIDRVDREHERIIVTRNGRPAAVLISPDDLDSLEETLELLGDQTAIRELIQADTAVAADDVVRGVDAVRALRSSPRR